MLEWIKDAIKMYYADLISHGMVMMVGFALNEVIHRLIEEGADNGRKGNDRGLQDTDQADS